ncbi:MAG: hypothetical protein N2B06_04815 [Clostridium sp.]
MNSNLFIPNTQNKYCATRIKCGALTVFIEEDDRPKFVMPNLPKFPKKYSNIRYNNSIVVDSNKDDIYNTLPKFSKSDCWWCTFPFDTVCISMPFSKTPSEYLFHGIFCSWNCMKSYSTSQRDTGVERRHELMNEILKIIYGKRIKIIPAPNRYRLIKYGGDLPIEAFRKSENILNFLTDSNLKVTPVTLYALKTFS